MIDLIRTRRLAVPVVAVVLAAFFAVAPVIGSQRPAAAATLPGTPNTSLTSFWQTVGNRASCADWSGGDSVNVVRTDQTGDKLAWFFADSFLGSPDLRHEYGGFYFSSIRNSIVVQDGSSTHTITGGHTCHETDTGGDFFSHYANTAMTTGSCAYTDDTHCVDSRSWFWNSGVTAEAAGHLIDAFYYRVIPDGSGAFPFKVMNAMVARIPTGDIFNDADGILDNGTGENDVNLYSLYCNNASEQVIWGADVSYTGYGDSAYEVWGWGVQSHKLYYAKVDAAAEIYDLSTWQFRTSNGFSGDCAQADPQTSFTVQSAFSVIPKNDSSAPDGVRYWLVQEEPGTTGSLILAYPSDHPWSFPDKAVTLYNEPEGHHTGPAWTFTYDARVIPYGSTGKYTIAYNVNTSGVDIGCGSRNKWDASIYRPRFIDVPPSALTASAAVDRSSAASTTAVADTLAGHGIRNSQGTRPRAASQSPATAPPTRAVPLEASVPGTRSRQENVSAEAADDTWYDSWSSAFDSNHHCPPLQNYKPGLAGTNNPDGSVAMRWGDIGKDVWYWIYQRDVTLGQGFKRMELWSTEPALTVNPITSKDVNGHTFAWYVVPFASQSPDSNGNGMPDVEGQASDNLQGPIWMQRPSAPAGVTASGYDYGTVRLTWSGVTYPTSGNFYWIYYWTSTTTATRVGPWDSNSRSAIVAPLARGQQYYFAVSAENLAGEGPPSATVSAIAP
jgi:hypothetical protein